MALMARDKLTKCDIHFCYCQQYCQQYSFSVFLKALLLKFNLNILLNILLGSTEETTRNTSYSLPRPHKKKAREKGVSKLKPKKHEQEKMEGKQVGRIQLP